MRRSAFTGLILACLLAVLPSSAAWAHPGATVFTIQMDASTSIPILVPADYGKPITEVDVTGAAGFSLQSGDPPAGWSVRRAGDTLVFSGGEIASGDGFTVFAIRGVATTKGEKLFPITTHSPDGTVMRYDGQPGSTNQGAIVYAGVIPHVASRRGFPWLRTGGGLAAGVGVVGTVVILLRRRRDATRSAVAATAEVARSGAESGRA